VQPHGQQGLRHALMAAAALPRGCPAAAHLLPRLAHEAEVRLDGELDACSLELLCKLVELIHRQRQPKVGHGNRVAVHLRAPARVSPGQASLAAAPRR
jgi:hypothetical protein